MERKTRQVCCFAKADVLMLDLNESREGFFRRARGRSFRVEWPKTEMAQEPPVERLVRGIWRLRIRSRAESAGGCVKLKTVADMRRRNARASTVAETAYLVQCVPLVNRLGGGGGGGVQPGMTDYNRQVTGCEGHVIGS